VVEIFNAISHKLYGRYVRFTSWFETILIHNVIWNDFDLHRDLEWYWFTSWFGTILIYNVIWNDFDLERFWFGTILIYNVIWNDFNLERFWFGTILIWNDFDLQRDLWAIYQVFLALTSSEPVRPYTLIRELSLIDYFVLAK